jgi:hypothetical protein
MSLQTCNSGRYRDLEPEVRAARGSGGSCHKSSAAALASVSRPEACDPGEGGGMQRSASQREGLPPQNALRLNAEGPANQAARAHRLAVRPPWLQLCLHHGLFLQVLTDHYLKGRYPADLQAMLAWMDKTRAAWLLGQTERLCAMIRKHPAFSIL